MVYKKQLILPKKKPASPQWTPEEDKVLLQRIHLGDTMAQAAKELNRLFSTMRTRMSTSGRFDRLKKGPAKRRDIIEKKIIVNTQAIINEKIISKIPLPMEEPAPEDHLILTDLKASSCRWPYGDKSPFKFCGHTKQDPASPYCALHTKKAFSRSQIRPVQARQ